VDTGGLRKDLAFDQAAPSLGHYDLLCTPPLEWGNRPPCSGRWGSPIEAHVPIVTCLPILDSSIQSLNLLSQRWRAVIGLNERADVHRPRPILPSRTIRKYVDKTGIGNRERSRS
jgi:hypothetical protein